MANEKYLLNIYTIGFLSLNKSFVIAGIFFISISLFDLRAQTSAKRIYEEGPYPSHTPKYLFSEKIEEQEIQLKNNPLIKRFKKSRERYSSDPYRPIYHFVSPENMLNDPNGLCYWKDRWHLFYQAYPADEFPDSKDIKKRRQHWGHAVSKDLIYWRDLPYAIYPGIEKMAFSGSTVVEKDREKKIV
mgnify:CR=1 FL=1